MDDEKRIFSSDDWIKRYNTFTLTNSHDLCQVNELSIKTSDLCEKYIQSLVWTAHYYFQSCISQSWYYPYEFSPTLQDLSYYLQSNKRVRINPLATPYTPIEQLKFVFPSQSYHLCDELKDIDQSPVTELPPTYNLLKRYDWECDLIF